MYKIDMRNITYRETPLKDGALWYLVVAHFQIGSFWEVLGYITIGLTAASWIYGLLKNKHIDVLKVFNK